MLNSEGNEPAPPEQELTSTKKTRRANLASPLRFTKGGGQNAPATQTKHRRNLALPEATMNTIQDIRASTDAGTDTEVIKRALKLYKIVVASQQEGSQLTLRDNEGKDHQLIIL